jgi:hypothetical protein
MLPLYQKTREVVCDDAVNWLTGSEEPFNGSIYTGIPDLYDVYGFYSTQEVGINQRSEDYKTWFNVVAEAIFRRIAPGQCALFSQTDGKVLDIDGNVLCWLDKSVLLSIAAAKHNCTLLWHKIALDPGAQVSSHRPCYTHLLAFGKQFTYHTSLFQTPDVIDRGLMTWEKATGLNACIIGVAFLHYIVKTPVVINPFCGRGTILAVANCFGVAAVGIEVMAKRARRAGRRDLRKDLLSIPPEHLKLLGVRADVVTTIEEEVGRKSALEMLAEEEREIALEYAEATVDSNSEGEEA